MTTKPQSTTEPVRALAKELNGRYATLSGDTMVRFGQIISIIERHLAAPASAAPVVDEGDFNAWFATNHPFDWWAKERDGEPLAHRDRLLVTELARRAFYREGKVL